MSLTLLNRLVGEWLSSQVSLNEVHKASIVRAIAVFKSTNGGKEEIVSVLDLISFVSTEAAWEENELKLTPDEKTQLRTVINSSIISFFCEIEVSQDLLKTQFIANIFEMIASAKIDVNGKHAVCVSRLFLFLFNLNSNSSCHREACKAPLQVLETFVRNEIRSLDDLNAKIVAIKRNNPKTTDGDPADDIDSMDFEELLAHNLKDKYILENFAKELKPVGVRNAVKKFFSRTTSASSSSVASPQLSKVLRSSLAASERRQLHRDPAIQPVGANNDEEERGKDAHRLHCENKAEEEGRGTRMEIDKDDVRETVDSPICHQIAANLGKSAFESAEPPAGLCLCDNDQPDADAQSEGHAHDESPSPPLLSEASVSFASIPDGPSSQAEEGVACEGDADAQSGGNASEALSTTSQQNYNDQCNHDDQPTAAKSEEVNEDENIDRQRDESYLPGKASLLLEYLSNFDCEIQQSSTERLVIPSQQMNKEGGGGDCNYFYEPHQWRIFDCLRRINAKKNNKKRNTSRIDVFPSIIDELFEAMLQDSAPKNLKADEPCLAREIEDWLQWFVEGIKSTDCSIFDEQAASSLMNSLFQKCQEDSEATEEETKANGKQQKRKNKTQKRVSKMEANAGRWLLASIVMHKLFGKLHFPSKIENACLVLHAEKRNGKEVKIIATLLTVLCISLSRKGKGREDTESAKNIFNLISAGRHAPLNYELGLELMSFKSNANQPENENKVESPLAYYLRLQSSNNARGQRDDTISIQIVLEFIRLCLLHHEENSEMIREILEIIDAADEERTANKFLLSRNQCRYLMEDSNFPNEKTSAKCLTLALHPFVVEARTSKSNQGETAPHASDNEIAAQFLRWRQGHSEEFSNAIASEEFTLWAERYGSRDPHRYEFVWMDTEAFLSSWKWIRPRVPVWLDNISLEAIVEIISEEAKRDPFAAMRITFNRLKWFQKQLPPSFEFERRIELKDPKVSIRDLLTILLETGDTKLMWNPNEPTVGRWLWLELLRESIRIAKKETDFSLSAVKAFKFATGVVDSSTFVDVFLEKALAVVEGKSPSRACLLMVDIVTLLCTIAAAPPEDNAPEISLAMKKKIERISKVYAVTYSQSQIINEMRNDPTTKFCFDATKDRMSALSTFSMIAQSIVSGRRRLRELEPFGIIGVNMPDYLSVVTKLRDEYQRFKNECEEARRICDTINVLVQWLKTRSELRPANHNHDDTLLREMNNIPQKQIHNDTTSFFDIESARHVYEKIFAMSFDLTTAENQAHQVVAADRKDLIHLVTQILFSYRNPSIVAQTILEDELDGINPLAQQHERSRFGQALLGTMRRLIDFVIAPVSTKLPIQRMRNFLVDDETSKLSEIAIAIPLAGSKVGPALITSALNASFLAAARELLRKFFSIPLSDKQRAANDSEQEKQRWDSPAVTAALKDCDGSMQEAIKTICEIEGIVAVTRSIIERRHYTNRCSRDEILAACEAHNEDLSRIVADMSGDNSEDHDTLEQYRPFVPLIIALLLSHDNNHFGALEMRLQFICTKKLFEGIIVDKTIVNNLRSQLGMLGEIVEKRGSVSEGGRITAFMKKLESDRWALAIARRSDSLELEIRLLKFSEDDVDSTEVPTLKNLALKILHNSKDDPFSRHQALFESPATSGLSAALHAHIIKDLPSEFTVSVEKKSNGDDVILISADNVQKRIRIAAGNNSNDARMVSHFVNGSGEALATDIEAVMANCDSDKLICRIHSDLVQLLPLVSNALWKGYDDIDEIVLPLDYNNNPLENHTLALKSFTDIINNFLSASENNPHANWLYLLPNRIANRVSLATQKKDDDAITSESNASLVASVNALLRDPFAIAHGTSLSDIKTRIEQSEAFITLQTPNQPEKVVSALFYQECVPSAEEQLPMSITTPSNSTHTTTVRRDKHITSALHYVASKSPRWFEILFCHPKLTIHEAERFVDTMRVLPGGNYFIVGLECLSPKCRTELLTRLREIDQPIQVTIVMDEKDESRNLVVKLAPKIVAVDSPVAPPTTAVEAMETAIANAASSVQPSSVFVLGDHGSGKSRLICARENVVYLTCSGDEITVRDTAALTKTLIVMSQKNNSASSIVNVWVNIDQAMLRSERTRVGDSGNVSENSNHYTPHKLLSINRTLWMLIHNRVVEDDLGEVLAVPHNVRFFVEVPPITNRFLYDVPSNQDATLQTPDTCVGLRYISLALSSRQDTTMIVELKSGRNSLTETMRLGDEKSKDETAESQWKKELRLLHNQTCFAAKVIRNLTTAVDDFSTWSTAVTKISEALEVIEQAINQHTPFKTTAGREYNLLPRNLFANNGKFKFFVQSLDNSLAYFKDIMRVSTYVKSKAMRDGFIAASRLAIRGVVDRWEKDCMVTLDQLAPFGTVLYIDSQFIPYPISAFPSDDPIFALFPTRERRMKVARENFPTAPEGVLDLANIILGPSFNSDISNIIQVWKEKSIVTVSDILVRFICITDRQRCRVPLLVGGPTGVGKSFLIDTLFTVQVLRAQNKARDKLKQFKIERIAEAFQKALSRETSSDKVDEEFLLIFDGDSHKLADTFPEKWRAWRTKELSKIPLFDFPEEPGDLSRSKTNDKYENAALIKTYFKNIKFKNTSFKLVIHPDITEKEIIDFVEEAAELAITLNAPGTEDFAKLTIPVFFDEPNTSVRCAGLIKSIMCDSLNPRTGKRYGKNTPIWFVGAINPAGSHYATYVTHPALEHYQCLFSNIDSQQQALYISQLLRSTWNKVGSTMSGMQKEKLDAISDIVSKLQERCRQLFEGGTHKHAVSQRDVHRFAWLVETISILLAKAKEAASARAKSSEASSSSAAAASAQSNQDAVPSSFIHVALVAIHYTYVTRFQQTNRLRAEMHNTLRELIHEHQLLPQGVNLDTIRVDLLKHIVNAENFIVGDGVALTNTLRENVFAALLACMSPIHKKTPVAIIGDSGMGKTLSNRIVERNLKGSELSDTAFCKLLPKSEFYYIQGAATTTSKQVDTVCHRAKLKQLKEPKLACTVSFDEASLTSKDALVHKALHEPVDCKIISIIVLSNKPFDDEANQNRFLVIWNQSLDREEVRELTMGCIGGVGNGALVDALADSFISIRANERWRSLYQTRDYIFLLKHIRSVNRVRNVTIDDIGHGIEFNYGSPERGMLQKVYTLIMNKLIDSRGENDDMHRNARISSVEKMLIRCYKRDNKDPLTRPRSVMIISPHDSYFGTENIDATIRHALTHMSDVERRTTGVNNHEITAHITLGAFPEDKTRENDCRKLSELRQAMEKGAHAIIRNPQRIISSLFDVFNLNFTTTSTVGANNERREIERAILAVGANSFKVPIHKNFRATLVYSSTEIQREIREGNTPFLSRAEMYLMEPPRADPIIVSHVRRFVKTVAQQRFAMFDEAITIPSAVKMAASAVSSSCVAAARGNGIGTDDMDPKDVQKWVFESNCQLLPLLSLDDLLSALPLFENSKPYLGRYLEVWTPTLSEFIHATIHKRSDMLASRDYDSSSYAQRRQQHHHVAIVTCDDVLGIHRLATREANGWGVLDVDAIKTSKELNDEIANCSRTSSHNIVILKMTRYHTDPNIMWAVREAITSEERKKNGSRDFKFYIILTSSAPCAVASIEPFLSFARIDTIDPPSRGDHESDFAGQTSTNVSVLLNILKVYAGRSVESTIPSMLVRRNLKMQAGHNLQGANAFTFLKTVTVSMLDALISDEAIRLHLTDMYQRTIVANASINNNEAEISNATSPTAPNPSPNFVIAKRKSVSGEIQRCGLQFLSSQLSNFFKLLNYTPILQVATSSFLTAEKMARMCQLSENYGIHRVIKARCVNRQQFQFSHPANPMLLNILIHAFTQLGKDSADTLTSTIQRSFGWLCREDMITEILSWHTDKLVVDCLYIGDIVDASALCGTQSSLQATVNEAFLETLNNEMNINYSAGESDAMAHCIAIQKVILALGMGLAPSFQRIRAEFTSLLFKKYADEPLQWIEKYALSPPESSNDGDRIDAIRRLTLAFSKLFQSKAKLGNLGKQDALQWAYALHLALSPNHSSSVTAADHGALKLSDTSSKSFVTLAVQNLQNVNSLPALRYIPAIILAVHCATSSSSLDSVKQDLRAVYKDARHTRGFTHFILENMMTKIHLLTSNNAKRKKKPSEEMIKKREKFQKDLLELAVEDLILFIHHVEKKETDLTGKSPDVDSKEFIQNAIFDLWSGQRVPSASPSTPPYPSLFVLIHDALARQFAHDDDDNDKYDIEDDEDEENVGHQYFILKSIHQHAKMMRRATGLSPQHNGKHGAAQSAPLPPYLATLQDVYNRVALQQEEGSQGGEKGKYESCKRSLMGYKGVARENAFKLHNKAADAGLCNAFALVRRHLNTVQHLSSLEALYVRMRKTSSAIIKRKDCIANNDANDSELNQLKRILSTSEGAVPMQQELDKNKISFEYNAAVQILLAEENLLSGEERKLFQPLSDSSFSSMWSSDADLPFVACASVKPSLTTSTASNVLVCRGLIDSVLSRLHSLCESQLTAAQKFIVGNGSGWDDYAAIPSLLKSELVTATAMRYDGGSSGGQWISSQWENKQSDFYNLFCFLEGLAACLEDGAFASTAEIKKDITMALYFLFCVTARIQLEEHGTIIKALPAVSLPPPKAVTTNRRKETRPANEESGAEEEENLGINDRAKRLLEVFSHFDHVYKEGLRQSGSGEDDDTDDASEPPKSSDGGGDLISLMRLKGLLQRVRVDAASAAASTGGEDTNELDTLLIKRLPDCPEELKEYIDPLTRTAATAATTQPSSNVLPPSPLPLSAPLMLRDASLCVDAITRLCEHKLDEIHRVRHADGAAKLYSEIDEEQHASCSAPQQYGRQPAAACDSASYVSPDNKSSTCPPALADNNVDDAHEDETALGDEFDDDFGNGDAEELFPCDDDDDFGNDDAEELFPCDDDDE